jgi:hypothetical protein
MSVDIEGKNEKKSLSFPEKYFGTVLLDTIYFILSCR